MRISDGVLDAALEALRDSNGNVRLDYGFTNSSSDPERDWIRPALEAAVAQATLEEFGNPDDVRETLERYMHQWSEDTYSAGWLNDLEHVMARCDEQPFRALVQLAGGWWTFNPTAQADYKRTGRYELRKFVQGTWEQLHEEAYRS